MTLRSIGRRAQAVYMLAPALFLTLVLAACGNGSGPSGDSSGDRTAAPEFALEVFENVNYDRGEPVSLDTFEDVPVVLNFWYPSCPPCRLEMPEFEASSREFAGQVAFVGVQLLGLDSVEDGQEFVGEFGISYAIGPDGKGTIVKEYNVTTFPTTVFIDSEHNIVRKWAGPLTRSKLAELIGEILPEA